MQDMFYMLSSAAVSGCFMKPVPLLPRTCRGACGRGEYRIHRMAQQRLVQATAAERGKYLHRLALHRVAKVHDGRICCRGSHNGSLLCSRPPLKHRPAGCTA